MGAGGLSHKTAHAPLLSFANGGKRRREGERESVVLENVCFELQPGGTLGIYGQRRSGKSTLLRLAAGLELSDGGSVRFEGRELERMSGGERARLLRGPIARNALNVTSDPTPFGSPVVISSRFMTSR